MEASTTHAAEIKPQSGMPFIPRHLDDYGLNAAQFRVVCRVARRGNCDESIPNIAKGCRLHKDTVADCLRVAVDERILRKIKRRGMTCVYALNHPDEWKRPPRKEGSPERKGPPLVSGGTTPKGRVNHQGEKKGDKGNPSEGNPSKGTPPGISTAEMIKYEKSLERANARLNELKGADLPAAIQERTKLKAERQRLMILLEVKA